jgi:hypothetical protein
MYLSSSLQRALEIEWRLQRLEVMMPDPVMIQSIRHLLTEKTILIQELKEKNANGLLSVQNRSEARDKIDTTQLEIWDLVAQQGRGTKDFEHIIEDEVRTISSLMKR